MAAGARAGRRGGRGAARAIVGDAAVGRPRRRSAPGSARRRAGPARSRWPPGEPSTRKTFSASKSASIRGAARRRSALFRADRPGPASRRTGRRRARPGGRPEVAGCPLGSRPFAQPSARGRAEVGLGRRDAWGGASALARAPAPSSSSPRLAQQGADRLLGLSRTRPRRSGRSGPGPRRRSGTSRASTGCRRRPRCRSRCPGRPGRRARSGRSRPRRCRRRARTGTRACGRRRS